MAETSTKIFCSCAIPQTIHNFHFRYEIYLFILFMYFILRSMFVLLTKKPKHKEYTRFVCEYKDDSGHHETHK